MTLEQWYQLIERGVIALEGIEKNTQGVLPPTNSSAIYQSNNWLVDFPTDWTKTCSPETMVGSNESMYADIIPSAPDSLTFELLKPPHPDTQSGARALYDPDHNKGWEEFASFYGKTVEFLDTWNFPTEIPNYYGENGFMQWAWQFKADASSGANASMAVCLHTFKGEGMRPYLTTNTWAGRAEDITFPVLPVGMDFDTRLLVHFHSDPELGWMEFHYAGRVLRVKGANMSANGGCGVYMNLYGTASGTMINRRTKFSVVET
jgi:hypothetical protein